MRRICAIIVMIIAFGISFPVYAEEFFINDYGVSLNKFEYDYISNLYWNGYQNYITQEDYDYIYNHNLFGQNIQSVSSIDNIQNGYNPNLTQNGRTLTISKSCSSICIVVMNLVWNGSATVKSNDVIGARLIGTSVTNYGNTIVTGDGYSLVYSSPQTFTNGFGYSALYPNTTNVKYTTTFYTTTGGSIRGSHQHAMSNISLSNSKLYTISSTGYGGVFSFYGAASGVYDAMNGLTVSLS